MRSERTWGRSASGVPPEVRCPACRKALAVDERPVSLFQVVRCRLCEHRLHVVSIEPLVLRVFKTYGLALVDD